MHTANEARLAKLSINASRECVETAIVFDNYATIQETVDAVSENGNVLVKSGTYDEDIVDIYKSGIKIEAIGDVTLNGRFGIEDYVDNITIQNFKIAMTNAFFEVAIAGGE